MMLQRPRNILFVVVCTVACILSLGIAGIAGVAKKSPNPSTAERVVKLLSDIEENLNVTEYRHRTRVRVLQGEYRFDCSGMAAWVLRRTAPQALRVIGRPNGRRPLAVHFYNQIAKVKAGKRRGPWYRVSKPMEARPGDVIAWVRPKWFPSKNTGHVAFVVGNPTLNTGPVPGVLLRIADASRYKHENDSRTVGVTGFGTGVLLIPTDENGDPLGYGWFGSRTQPDWVVPTKLAIGRPLW